jgi:hypothetical protein
MPEDAEILPPPEELKGALSGCAVDRDSEGIRMKPGASQETQPGGGALDHFAAAGDAEGDASGCQVGHHGEGLT